ncbi:hypothetical protein [Hugenholtzia roseola]|uniref:hypothetical protein n=1 Tax=Hugenholtzia roseola TaxID=1002 RepID=UPI00047B6521|nr:hypothetical protein [Hugenholtzia roseola]
MKKIYTKTIIYLVLFFNYLNCFSQNESQIKNSIHIDKLINNNIVITTDSLNYRILELISPDKFQKKYIKYAQKLDTTYSILLRENPKVDTVIFLLTQHYYYSNVLNRDILKCENIINEKKIMETHWMLFYLEK